MSNESSMLPGFPEGWFRVGYSQDLPAGHVAPLHYFGRALVMFRTESGIVQVLDAHCAHLGAHLGMGGTVVGETLRCPFHAWAYGADGMCKKIPYSKQVPKAAAVRSWQTIERAGLILMWYSPVSNPPRWEAPTLHEHGGADWTKEYLRKRYVIRTSAQEIVENIPDLAHFAVVHGNAGGGRPPDFKFDFVGQTMSGTLRLELPAIGSEAVHTVTVHGLGLVTNLSVSMGSKSFWTTYTPIDDKTVEVDFAMLAALKTATDPSGEISAASRQVTLREFEKDIPIWENKIYRANPLILQEDGPIGRFRVWARQFYPQA